VYISCGLYLFFLGFAQAGSMVISIEDIGRRAAFLDMARVPAIDDEPGVGAHPPRRFVPHVTKEVRA
jgi:hypothetical protein